MPPQRVALLFLGIQLLLPWGHLPSVRASLDPVRGPREHPVVETFGVPFESLLSDLDRQLLAVAPTGDNELLAITNLITAGANPNCYDENHYTPLHYAVVKGQRLAVERLTERGAHPDARDAWMRTPVHFAAAFGWGDTFPSVVTALYNAGANMNSGDQSENTPLHLAAAEGHTSTVSQLILYGARLNPINKWGQLTPLGMAVVREHTETADFLRAAGAVDEKVSFLEPEIKRCSDPRDAQKICNSVAVCNWGGTCAASCANPPCQAKCIGDQSSLKIPGNVWGCALNNYFMAPQPVIDPQPPKPGAQLGIIQGTTVS
mmetsp:Transcript_17244/g.42113  ORF Transcript_17244/g.42113 Transcript_17244/m.42113 type:complete len:318 (-) Transcript_17244:176-1129(-)